MRMNRTSMLAALGVMLLIGCNSQENAEDKYSGEKFTQHIRPTEALSPEEAQKVFKLPPGFEIELYVSEPDIGKPMNISFDAKGRLWVTQSSEYPFVAPPGEGSDRITILEDTNNDGKADRFTQFVDTLNNPIGILPVHDGAVAFSIPSVYRFMDADDDGVADSREKLIGQFSYEDNHGMVNGLTRGFDGWIHSNHGFNSSKVSGTDGEQVHMDFGGTFRFRPDGSDVEMTSYGRINPFGLTFDERGYLYSSDCHTSPLYQIIKGADYPRWQGRGDGAAIGYAPVMKPLDREKTALAGLGYYSDVLFPEEYQKNFFVGDVVASRVFRYSVDFKGSSPIGNMEADFIVTEDPWFRPVDIKLGPDGALYVADFYNRIIGHYEVPLDHPQRDRHRGRIWRITYNGEENEVKDWTTASVEELVEALDADNMPVRMTAANQLVDRIGEPAIEPVKKMINNDTSGARAYVRGLWVLQRLNALTGSLTEQSAGHSDPLVRLHTMRIFGELKDDDHELLPLISEALDDGDPHVQRAATELLVNYPTLSSLEYALAVRDEVSDYDTHLLYTTRLILRNLLRNNRLFQQVISREWDEREAGYLADVMVGVHSAESAMFMLDYIEEYPLPAYNQVNVFQHIARFIPYEQLDEVVNTANRKKGDDIDAEFQIFSGIQQGIARRGAGENDQLIQWGRALAEDLLNEYPSGNPLETSEEILSRQLFAVRLAGDYKMPELASELRAFVEDPTNLDIEDPDWDTFLKLGTILDLKTSALRSLLKIDTEEYAALAARVLQDDTELTEFRRRTAEVLGEFPGPAVNKVLGEVDHVPGNVQSAVIMSLASSPEGKDIIFDQVRRGVLFVRTLVEPKVKERILLNISPEQREVFEELTANLEPISQEKQVLILTRLQGFNAIEEPSSPDEGRIVFDQNCAICHKIGDEGGNVGPNLDGIGAWGAHGLAEKILDPNRNINETFRTYTVELKDGRVMTGLYRGEEGEVMVFADAAGQEFTVPKDDIEARTASRYSLMPDNFGESLSQKEFNALLTYLLSLKN